MCDAKKVLILGKTGFMQQNFLATKFNSRYFVDFVRLLKFPHWQNIFLDIISSNIIVYLIWDSDT